MYEKRFYLYEKRFCLYEKRLNMNEKRFYLYEKQFYLYEKRFYLYKKQCYLYEKQSGDRRSNLLGHKHPLLNFYSTKKQNHKNTELQGKFKTEKPSLNGKIKSSNTSNE